MVPVQTVTYAEPGALLKISPKAARSLVRRYRFGKALVSVDLA